MNNLIVFIYTDSFKTDVSKALSCSSFNECLKALCNETKRVKHDNVKAFDIVNSESNNMLYSSFLTHTSLLLAFKHARIDVLTNVRSAVLRRAESETNRNKLIALNAQHIRITQHIESMFKDCHALLMNS